MKKKSKIWVLGYFMIIIMALAIVAKWVIRVDPFFHYHKPYLESYFYTLDNQRSQNDGISKHFDYDGLITGTSMTENFKTSEMDAFFGTKSVKVCYSGGSFKEINDNLKVALHYNPNLKMIIRGLDMAKFIEDKDLVRKELGEYPTYLYDGNPFNDVNYIFNRDVVFGRVYPMILANDDEEFQPGITSFDVYSNWMTGDRFGVNAVCPEGVSEAKTGKAVYLSNREKELLLENVQQNITSLAESYPDVTFYYFFTPYSIMWWQPMVNSGAVYKQVEAEKLVIEEILKCDNIKLYSFNTQPDIITDINNYKDEMHYGSWINSLMLKYMKEGKGLLTYDNYVSYLEEELTFYTSYDYSQLNEQEDYERDYYAQARLEQTINGVVPLVVTEEILREAQLDSAVIVEDQYAGTWGIECRGCVQREPGSDTSFADYISTNDFVGAKIIVDDIGQYKYLTYYGKKVRDQGQPGVYVYGEDNSILAELNADYQDIDNEWHQYLIDVSQLEGRVTIIFNGGYVDNTGSEDSRYLFSDIALY